ncbi:MAG: hypothetical protein KF789_01375 [Bdellovibrionaceae bacterium]|nr:hypothetical protein [Pseudobdellovibrionaceae bacterium]
MKNRLIPATITTFATAVLLAGCSKPADSFSLLSDEASFKQDVAYVQRKVDILWVIDNSGSMDISQQKLASNFQSFINRFEQLGYDFQMGVVTTFAYQDYYYGTKDRSRLKDRGRDTKGTDTCNDDTDRYTGVRIMNKNTPNLNQVFMSNIMQGICGGGDERGLSSIEMALSNPDNQSLLRPGAFLSIIVVSDEHDTSYEDWQNGISSYAAWDGFPSWNKPTLFPISRFVNFLNTKTNSVTGGIRNWSVSTIAVLDSACKTQLDNADTSGFKRTYGTRYADMADASQGTKGSLCDNFGDTLSTISDQVVNLASVFKLNREPIESTITVRVNGVAIPKDATNGWTYDAATIAIHFHGSAIPAAGADVRIAFDPKSVKL